MGILIKHVTLIGCSIFVGSCCQGLGFLAWAIAGTIIRFRSAGKYCSGLNSKQGQFAKSMLLEQSGKFMFVMLIIMWSYLLIGTIALILALIFAKDKEEEGED